MPSRSSVSRRKITDLNEDIVFRILGYVTFTERERYSNLSSTFKNAVQSWYRFETNFPNRFISFEEEFDRKYNIKKVLLKYPNMKSVDATKLRNNSMRETNDLIVFWTKQKKLIHIKPCNDYGWIRVLREPLIDLFKSCPITSIDLVSRPASCFNDSFLRGILPAERMERIKTNFLEGFRLKQFVSLRKLQLDLVTIGQLKQVLNHFFY